MTKSELINTIAKRTSNLDPPDVEVVVNTLLETMTQWMCEGERIEIRGFGSFSVRQRDARTGRNPKTGETIEVPAKRIPFFTVGNELRERINQNFLDSSSAK